VHSIVSQEVIAIGAQKLNLQAVGERAASGQLLFLGSSFGRNSNAFLPQQSDAAGLDKTTLLRIFGSQLAVFTRYTDPFGHILAQRHVSNISSTTLAARQNNGQKMDFLPCSITDVARWPLAVTTTLAWRALRIENKKTRRNIFK
jgi:hypothetical protein